MDFNSTEECSDELVKRPSHPNQYSDKIDQLFALAKALENRLEPVLDQSPRPDGERDSYSSQLLEDLAKVVDRFEGITSRINL